MIKGISFSGGGGPVMPLLAEKAMTAISTFYELVKFSVPLTGKTI